MRFVSEMSLGRETQLMTYKDKGKTIRPISVTMINDSFIVAVYKGKKSAADIVVRYRQRLKNGGWSRIRTPKHIHWTVDILLKMLKCDKLTKKFLDELIKIWEKDVHPLSEEDVKKLDLNQLVISKKDILERFKELNRYGEYSVDFLLLIAELLMLQEKTNYPSGKLFLILLKKLKEGEDLFSIVQTASLRRLQ